MKRIILSFLFALAWTSGVLAADPSHQPIDAEKQKVEDILLRAHLEKRVEEITADAAAFEAAMKEGRERAATCIHCHGEDGNSTKPGTPSLAGQSPVYIVDQFQRYADKRRYDPWMANLAATFTEGDKLKLALYFSQQNMTPSGGGDPELLDLGHERFTTLCVECHGEDGRGKEGYARLAGQRPEYLMKMLKEFKKPTGHRYNPWMFARANMLSNEQEMLAVATYLAQLK